MDTPFIFFYRLECMHGPRIVKKNKNQIYFFFIKFDHKFIFLDTIRLQIGCSFRIYEYICTCMHIKKNIDVFLLTQFNRHGVLEIDFFS